jgi:cytochrome bd-type quinol oxidase subunit 2
MLKQKPSESSQHPARQSTSELMAREVVVSRAVPALVLAFIVGAIFFHPRREAGRAFLSSSLSIAAIWGLVGSGLFPRLVPAVDAPELSLTFGNASSGDLTLKTMIVIAVIGYTLREYWAFKGKLDARHEPSHY